MSVEFENRETRIPFGRAGTAPQTGSSRVVPSLSSPDSIARKMSRLGARRRQSSFAKASADRCFGGQGASPHRLLVWKAAKTGLIGACSNPENRNESASIGPNRSESELSILFCDADRAQSVLWQQNVQKRAHLGNPRQPRRHWTRKGILSCSQRDHCRRKSVAKAASPDLGCSHALTD